MKKDSLKDFFKKIFPNYKFLLLFGISFFLTFVTLNENFSKKIGELTYTPLIFTSSSHSSFYSQNIQAVVISLEKTKLSNNWQSLYLQTYLKDLVTVNKKNNSEINSGLTRENSINRIKDLYSEYGIQSDLFTMGSRVLSINPVLMKRTIEILQQKALTSPKCKSSKKIDIIIEADRLYNFIVFVDIEGEFIPQQNKKDNLNIIEGDTKITKNKIKKCKVFIMESIQKYLSTTLSGAIKEYVFFTNDLIENNFRLEKKSPIIEQSINDDLSFQTSIDRKIFAYYEGNKKIFNEFISSYEKNNQLFVETIKDNLSSFSYKQGQKANISKNGVFVILSFLFAIGINVLLHLKSLSLFKKK